MQGLSTVLGAPALGPDSQLITTHDVLALIFLFPYLTGCET